MTRFLHLLDWGRIAGRLYGNGAAETAFVSVCLQTGATVDTTDSLDVC